MAQRVNAENIEENVRLEIPEQNVMTGDKHVDRMLYYQLLNSISKAERIDIIVSFLMESGVKMLVKGFRKAVERGVKIRILTGNYLGITQPSALYLLKREFGDAIELRFYNEKGRSFHPKAYIIHYQKYSDLFIGSSNISRSALSSGIEWNYRFSSEKDPKNFAMFYQTFEDLYENHAIEIDDDVLKKYAQNWHRPSAMDSLETYDEADEHRKVAMLYEPRGAQIEALCALEQTRAEGAKKALIMAATGIGKTYLAAFDSVKYKSVLFVAHREEILRQAAQSFKNVRHSDDYGFFNGKEKCTDKSVIFASVATLGNPTYLNDAYFLKNQFDYIVVDEFHHAVNQQYKWIISYFNPQFLLGLTATPDRMDGRNIYELCDYNVPYEIGVKEGINRGMLVPFHYYGIYDDTDYSSLHLVKGHYDSKELNETYIGNVHRHDLIYKYYCKYGSKQALGFCCTREHAEEMAKEFSKRGIPAVAVYSNSNGEYARDRQEAIESLKRGEIRVIFSVDMFNEGVDITSVDMVMFLRPTDSPVVFMQQLGRGLRKCKGKKYLNVLDFIGNYHKAGRIRYLLTGRKSGAGQFDYAQQDDYPDGCLIDFDMRLIDLFAEMDKKLVKLREQIYHEYCRIKDMLGERPSRVDFFTYMDEDVYQKAVAHAKDNPFKNYLGFLKEHNELNEGEMALCNGIGYEFIKLIENTNMTKVYKMPVSQAIYNDSDIRMEVTNEEIVDCWKAFFDANENWRDFDSDMTYEKYRNITDKAHLKKIIQMPVNFLIKSGDGFFCKKEGYAIALNDDLKDVVKKEAFAEQMRDVVEYRVLDYYQRRYDRKKSG